MKQFFLFACLSAGLSLAVVGQPAAAEKGAVAEGPPPLQPISIEDRIAGAEVFSLQAARMDGAFGAALNDLARHLVLETPADAFAANGIAVKDLRAVERPVEVVTQRIMDLSRRAGERARALHRIEEALDGLEGIASKGLGLVRIRLDAGETPVEPDLPAESEHTQSNLAAARDLSLTTSATMSLRADTMTLLERVQSLPRNPEDEAPLPASVAAQLAERTKRLLALMDAGAIGRRAARPANWQEAVRDSMDRLTTDLKNAVHTAPSSPTYATVDAQLLLAFLRLQAVHGTLYAKDLARFHDRTASFPLQDHLNLSATLSGTLADLRLRAGWEQAYRGLKTAYEAEVKKTNDLAAEYDFKLIADYADLLPKQRSLCLQSENAADAENMVYRINAIVTFDYGRQGDLAVTGIGRGPVVREPTASRVLPDGFEPDCIDVQTSDWDDAGEQLEARADEIIALMRLHLSRVEMLARHANLMRDLDARAQAAAEDLTGLQAALQSEPKTIARYGYNLSCTAQEDAKLRGAGEATISLRVNAAGEVVKAYMIDDSKFDGSAKRLVRAVRSAFTCAPYEPLHIDGKPVDARKKVTVTLTQ